MAKKLELKKLRRQCGMSQSDLARRLGISRPTLVKIERGERPLKLAEKSKVRELFELTDGVAGAGDLRIDVPQQKLEKFKQVLLYILEKVGSKPNVGLTVLYKLLYFIDFDYYEKYEEQLMGLTYIRNQHGPTPKEFVQVVEQMKKDEELEELQSKYFKYDQRKYLPLRKPDLAHLSGQELAMIDAVLMRLSDMTAFELSTYSHGDLPWMAHAHADGEEIKYESALYRSDEYSVRDELQDFDDAAGMDSLRELGPMSDEEHNYYMNL